MKGIIKETIEKIIIPFICMITTYLVVSQLVEIMGWGDDMCLIIGLLATLIFCVIILYLSLKMK